MTSPLVPRLGLLLGLGGSIAANVRFGQVTGQPTEAIAAAVLWPVLVWVSIELAVATQWPTGLSWQLVRFSGPLLVAAIAAVVSYTHMSGLFGLWHYPSIAATLGPAAVETLVLTSTGALVGAGVLSRTSATVTPTQVDAAPVVETLPVPVPAATVSPVTDHLVPVLNGASPVTDRLMPMDATSPVREFITHPAAPVATTVTASPVTDHRVPASDSPIVRSTVEPRLLRRSESRAQRRTREETLEALRAAVAAGDLPANPSQRAARELLGGGQDQVRWAVARLREDQPLPGFPALHAVPSPITAAQGA